MDIELFDTLQNKQKGTGMKRTPGKMRVAKSKNESISKVRDTPVEVDSKNPGRSVPSRNQG